MSSNSPFVMPSQRKGFGVSKYLIPQFKNVTAGPLSETPYGRISYGEYTPELNRTNQNLSTRRAMGKPSKKGIALKVGSAYEAILAEKRKRDLEKLRPPVELPRYLGSADSLEARSMQEAGLQPSDTSLLRALNAPAPDIPRTDLTDLWGLLSPGVNQAYDALDRSLQEGQSAFRKDFGGITQRLAQSFSGSGADFANTTGQNVQDIAGTLNRLGVGDAANGPTAQMRMTQEARLSNLGNMLRESLGANLDTLGTARGQMFDTFRAAGNAGRAGGIQGLAQALVGAQSDADLSRSELLSEAYGKQLENELKLREYMQDREMKQLEMDLKKQELLAAMQPDRGKVSVTETTENPGLMEDVFSIPDDRLRKTAIEALLTTGGPDLAIQKLFGANLPMTDEEKKENLYKKLVNQVNRMADATTRQQAATYFMPYSPQYGGKSTKITSKRGNE